MLPDPLCTARGVSDVSDIISNPNRGSRGSLPLAAGGIFL